MRLLARIALAIAGLGLASSCQAQPTEREFSEAMLPQMEAAMPGATLALDPDDPLTIRLSNWQGWEDAQINLHRIYGFCLNNPAKDCAAVKAEFVDHLAEKPPESSANSLRVIVRDRQYWDYIAQTFPDKGKLPPHRQIGDDLLAILAFDNPKTIALAQPERLAELGLDEEAAWALARKQMAAILPALPDGAGLREQPVAFEDFEYLASLLDNTAGWDKVARDAGPDMFLTVVSDRFVFVGVMPPGQQLERFRRTVEDDCKAQPRCVSPNIYRFRDGRWVVAP
ncbi:MAG: hypothetical protein IE933_01310 [Sphingomonadales bacterium]|nr:hypothetical protein [Sphingomonadales bacterium]MBD3772006.1 hypothetical protein [Paracoccaceae bacterium]